MIGTLLIGIAIGMMVEFICICLVVAYFAKENKKDEGRDYYEG